jgi:hypothetical protein
MNIDPTAPAFPQFSMNEEWEFLPGLTIRAELAARMMAGFAASSCLDGTIELHAQYAVRWADALIEELNKPTT